MSPKDRMEALEAQLNHTLEGTDRPDLGDFYKGKVRDVYRTKERLIIITTDRVSAFDRVLGTIPFKGEILNRMAKDGFDRTEDIVPNHVVSMPDPNVIVARPCKTYPVEFIVRGYITGSLWRDYQSGKSKAYGIPFPQDLKKDQRFDQPILTPSTKAEIGEHDEPISQGEIVKRGLMTKEQLEEASEVAMKLYARGAERAAEHGLILVDTKYELGRDEADRLTAIDEIHTPDSSRFWIAEEYEEHFTKSESQKMLDKENLRGWLIETYNFTGHGEAPELTQEIRMTLASRYFDAFERITGQQFDPQVGAVKDRINENLKRAGF